MWAADRSNDHPCAQIPLVHSSLQFHFFAGHTPGTRLSGTDLHWDDSCEQLRGMYTH